MQGHAQSPILRRSATVRRTDALFAAMAEDNLLRQQFVTNPVGVLSEYVRGVPLTADETASGNALVYAALSDRGFLDWLHRYAAEREDAMPDGKQFVQDFARSLGAGSHAIVLALAHSAIEGRHLVGFDEDLLHFFLNLSRLVVDGDRAEDGGAVGVAGDGTLTAVTWETWLITRPQAEAGDGFSAGQARAFAPRYVMVALDELARYAAALNRNGALAFS